MKQLPKIKMEMNRIAVLSDIHGNVWALKAVLSDIESKGIKTVINLGDIFYGPLEPRKTYELIKDVPVVTIRGNQDRQLLEATEHELKCNRTMRFVLNDLGIDPLRWLEKFSVTSVVSDNIFLCYGTPGSDTAYFLEDISDGYAKVRNEVDIMSIADRVRESLILCGHTHIPRLVTLSNGKYIVNPGSVGLPAYEEDEPVHHKMETNSPHASYSVIDITNHGIGVEFVKVPYEYDMAGRAAEKRGRKDWAFALETGRTLP